MNGSQHTVLVQQVLEEDPGIPSASRTGVQGQVVFRFIGHHCYFPCEFYAFVSPPAKDGDTSIFQVDDMGGDCLLAAHG